MGKETGHRGGQRLHHDACYVATVVGENAHLSSEEIKLVSLEGIS